MIDGLPERKLTWGDGASSEQRRIAAEAYVAERVPQEPVFCPIDPRSAVDATDQEGFVPQLNGYFKSGRSWTGQDQPPLKASETG
ncbi:MAG: hypothetical protein ABSF35_20945 [Polyangia bacterium]|jgi:hypothetical protein